MGRNRRTTGGGSGRAREEELLAGNERVDVDRDATAELAVRGSSFVDSVSL